MPIFSEIKVLHVLLGAFRQSYYSLTEVEKALKFGPFFDGKLFKCFAEYQTALNESKYIINDLY